MIFSVVVVLLIAAIAYFHYTQGFFSATISAIVAVLAAVLAFSYHEVVVFSLLKGRVANYAHGMILIALFAAAYLILRITIDSLIPGNIRVPVMVDRIGAAVMGIIAGIFATGILAIAAGTMPFGPSGPYARYELQDVPQVVVPTVGGRSDMDASIRDKLKDAKPGEFNRERAGGMIVPADEIVVNMVDRLSTGALAGTRPLKTVHPAYLDETFGQRLGMQVGSSRVALNVDNKNQVTLQGLYSLEQVAQADSEYPQLRLGDLQVEPLRKPMPDQILLVARIQFGQDADDDDNNVRFSTGSVRLVADLNNYMPLGTLDEAGVLRVNVPDDFLLAPTNASVDLVFIVPRAALGIEQAARRAGAAADAGAPKVADGVFLEVKRMAILDLSGRSVEGYPGALEKTVFRKRGIPEPKAPAGAGATASAAARGGAAAAPAPDAPIVVSRAEVSEKLFAPINVGAAPENGEATFTSGAATIREKKFAKLSVNMTETIQRLGAGENTVDEFFVPPGMKMVQIVAQAPAQSPPEPWDWAEKLGQFELVDAAGAKHKPRGAWAQVTGAQGSKRMVAAYNADADVTEVPHEEGRPTDVWIAFHVPAGTQLKELTFNGQRVAELNQQVQ